jgi:hypothetical protein
VSDIQVSWCAFVTPRSTSVSAFFTASSIRSRGSPSTACVIPRARSTLLVRSCRYCSGFSFAISWMNPGGPSSRGWPWASTPAQAPACTRGSGFGVSGVGGVIAVLILLDWSDPAGAGGSAAAAAAHENTLARQKAISRRIIQNSRAVQELLCHPGRPSGPNRDIPCTCW